MQRYEINKEESARLSALKVLMCIFVLVIHAFSNSIGVKVSPDTKLLYQATFVLSRIICDCAVPVFILISAVLLYRKPFDWEKNARKKCCSLLLPYMIFNTLWIVQVFAKHVLGKKLGITVGNDIDLAAFSLFDWVDAYFGLTGDYKPLLTTLWYVRDLFLLNLLAKPIQKLVDKFPIPVLVLVMAVWFLGIPVYFIQAYSLIFFVLGYYLVKYNLHLQDLDRLNSKAVAAVYIVVLLADIMLQRKVTIVNRIFICISVVLFAKLSKHGYRMARSINLIAPVTFFIYLTHQFVYVLIRVVLPDTIGAYLATYLLKPAAALASMTGLYYLMKRYTPELLAVLVGGRAVSRESERQNRKESVL